MTEETKVTVSDLDALCAEIFDARSKHDALDLLTKEQSKVVEKLKAKFAAYLKELDRDGYSSPVGSIGIVSKWNYKLPASDEDRGAFYSYLKEKGAFDRLISVNHNTLNSFCKAEQEAAEQAGHGMNFRIPGIGSPTLFETIQMRKAND